MFHKTHNLAGYIEGSLNPQASARLEKHLDKCAHCRAALADMRSVGLLLDATARSAGPVHYDTELWSRVHARIATPHRQAPLRPRWSSAGGGLALAAAAVCLVVIIGNHGSRHVGQQAGNTKLPAYATVAKAIPDSPHKTRIATVPKESNPPYRVTPNGNADAKFRPLNALTDTKPIPQSPPKSVAERETPLYQPEVKALVAEVPAGSRRSAKIEDLSSASHGDRNYFDNGNHPTRGSVVNDQHQTAIVAGRMGENAMGGASSGYLAQNGTPIAPPPSPAAAPSGGALLAYQGTAKLAAKPQAVRGAVASPAPGPALDIVSDKAPAMPNAPLLADRLLNGSALGLRTKAALLPIKDGMNRFRATTPETGVSTLKGRELFTKAESAFAAGDNPVALQLYADADKAGLSSSESRLTYVRRGDIALKNSDAVTAVKLYRTAVTKKKDAEVLYKLGDASERAGLVKEAIDAYREALSLAPDFKPAQEGLARVKKP